MNYGVEGLRVSGADGFAVAKRCLLPNEDARFVCHILKGFLVLTSRRVVLLKERKHPPYAIERVIPYDCIRDVKSERTGQAKILAMSLNRNGCHTNEILALDIRPPKSQSGEDKTEVKNHFRSTMNHCLNAVEEVRMEDGFSGDKPPIRDFSYLDDMPESLTSNAVLDLNTILQDRPIHDELIPEAKKLLGSKPFLLEESLRDGNDKENGVLFAAGKHGYYWVQGKKNCRFMSNVIVDTIEWENVLCFTYRWQREGAKIETAYRLTKDGNPITMQYQWYPPITEDSIHYPWLLQPSNGPWILADIMYRYSGMPMPASYIKEEDSTSCVQRYYP